MDIIATTAAPAAIGPYSQAMALGNLVLVSGQIPIDPQTGDLVQGSIADQTRQALGNIRAILAEAGCAMADVVKTTVLLRDIADFAEMNAAYAEFFPENAPARACFQVAALPGGARRLVLAPPESCGGLFPLAASLVAERAGLPVASGCSDRHSRPTWAKNSSRLA